MTRGRRLEHFTIVFVAVATVSSCMTIPAIDPAKERQLVADQMVAPADSVTALSRCQFGIVPGDRREMIDGVCAVSNGRLVLRTVDQASGRTQTFRVFEPEQGLSVAFCDSAMLKQTQLLAPGYSVGLVARPDGRVGFNDVATRALYDALVKAGWPAVPAKRRVNPGEGMPGFNAVGPTLACSFS